MSMFDDEESLMLDAVAEFTDQEVAPLVLDRLENDEFPQEILDRMAELGLFTLSLPEEYGGLGKGVVLSTAIESRIAQESLAVAFACGAGSLVQKAIIEKGTDQQKQDLLPLILNKPCAFALTEPEAGSDVSAITTTAVREGDGWAINGQKTFISFSAQADHFAVGCKTHETGNGGITMILVPRDTPGFSVGEPFHKLGFHGSGTAELFFDNVRVPYGNVIGTENKGMHLALSILDEARVGVAAYAVGMCDRAISTAATYIKQRIAFGKPLSTKQGLQWYFAEMDARTEAARALMYRAAANFDEGLPVSIDAARAKLVATEAAKFVTDKAVQICGGMGLMRDFGLERLYRDAKVLNIIEGTDEIQKMVIARSVLQ